MGVASLKKSLLMNSVILFLAFMDKKNKTKCVIIRDGLRLSGHS